MRTYTPYMYLGHTEYLDDRYRSTPSVLIVKDTFALLACDRKPDCISFLYSWPPKISRIISLSSLSNRFCICAHRKGSVIVKYCTRGKFLRWSLQNRLIKVCQYFCSCWLIMRPIRQIFWLYMLWLDWHKWTIEPHRVIFFFPLLS